jgi:PIN domain nuclease of toxin-antitoxin system
MTNPVLDASAVLALLWEEPGAEMVRGLPPGALISAVNFAEVITKLIERGVSGEDARTLAESLGHRVIDADQAQAMRAGLLRESTRRAGLSLGDRFCIALAEAVAAPALTADRGWKDLDLGIEITLIR